MKETNPTSVSSSRQKLIYSRSLNKIKPNTSNNNFNKSTSFNTSKTPFKYFLRNIEDKSSRQYYSKNFWDGPANKSSKENLQINPKEIPATCFNDTMNKLSNSYYSSRVLSRQVNTVVAAKSLTNFKRNPKEELASKIGDKIENFYKTSKDHDLERARKKNKFMETLIDKHLDKFSPSRDSGKTKYYNNYVDNSKTSFDHYKIPHSENVNHPRYRNYFSELKNQMISQQEENYNRKAKTLQEDQESMKRAQLRYEREQIECMQKKKMTNEILLQTNLKIHNEKKQKEITDREREKKEISESHRRQMQYLDYIHRESIDKKRKDQAIFFDNVKSQINSNYYTKR